MKKSWSDFRKKLKTTFTNESEKFSEEKKINVEGIELHFHSVPMGTYVVGSPASQKNRYDPNGASNNQYSIHAQTNVRPYVNEDLHKFTVKDDFFILEYPVCQGLWKAIVGKDFADYCGNQGLTDGKSLTIDEMIPVTYANIENVLFFLDKLNSLNSNGKIAEGFNFELPYASEWECAVRADDENSNAYYGGSIDKCAWYSGNANCIHRVGEKRKNSWGLADMLGNVWELCYEDKDTKNGVCLGTEIHQLDKRRVIKGGSWKSEAKDCRMACVKRPLPDDDYDDIGFRIIMRRKSPEQI